VSRNTALLNNIDPAVLKINNLLYLIAIETARRQQNIIMIPLLSYSLMIRFVCPLSGCPLSCTGEYCNSK
jgi:hypothetical protein